MDTILQSQVFFFISSIGFIILWALLAVFLYYLIRAMNTFSRVMDKIEGGVNTIGDTTKEMLGEIKNSLIFNFLFKKKKKPSKEPKGQK